MLGELCPRHPEAIVASNTSSISISALGEAAGVAERIVGTHYWNPPLLMPLVEVVAGERAADGLLERVVLLLRAIGKRPVVLEREAPGLLWNRLQLAVLRECEWLGLSDAKSGSGFAAHVPQDAEELATLRERRDSALAADLHAERG